MVPRPKELSAIPAEELFKQCTMCRECWRDYRQLVLDPELRLEGYMADFGDTGSGIILLTHLRQGCRTTLAVRAEGLRELYDGPEYTTRRTGEPECPRHCLDRDSLETCDAECSMAWVREIMQCLRRHELPAHVCAEALPDGPRQPQSTPS